jgi:putative ABC transport system permease protein
MKYLRLIFAQLLAHKLRTTLTLLSLTAAFLLFGLLQAVNVLFNAPPELSAPRLVTQARTSFTQALPMRLLAQIEAVPGVDAVMYQQWFGAVYQRPDQQLVAFAVDPARLRAVYPEWSMPDEQWDTFIRTRGSMMVPRVLASRFNWKVGDRVPLDSNIFPKLDGSKNWNFEVAGIYGGRDENSDRQAGVIYIDFASFDEARQFGKGGAGIFISKLKSADEAGRIGKEIDTKFENSSDETKSQSESDFNRNFVRQLGDISLIVNAILGAVFFTILLLTGNTMAQAVRERIPQLAVLKTLGFSNGKVLGMVLTESLVLIGMGALLGMLIATAIGKGVAAFFQRSGSIVDAKVWLLAAISALALALVVGLPPALRAARLKIVDALAGR